MLVQQLQEASELLREAVLGKEMLLGERGAWPTIQRLADVQRAIQQWNGVGFGSTDPGTKHGAESVTDSTSERDDNDDDGVEQLLQHYGVGHC